MAAQSDSIQELIDQAQRRDIALRQACNELELAELSGDAKRLKRANAAEGKACRAAVSAENRVLRAHAQNAQEVVLQLRFAAKYMEGVIIPENDMIGLIRRAAAILEQRA